MKRAVVASPKDAWGHPGEGFRILINRTDALGDVIISLPVVARILSRAPGTAIHVMVRDYTAPALEHHPALAGLHLRPPDADLEAFLSELQPKAVLNLSHRDGAVLVAAKRAGVPVRVGRARGLGQILAATHLLWKGRNGTGRHEAQNALDFLAPFGWSGGCPTPPRLFLTPEERAQGEADLAAIPRPRLGLVHRGSGSGAYPSPACWTRIADRVAGAGWHPVVIAPPETSDLPATSLRGLMARLSACDAVISPSTGPAHLAAALGVPLLVLMGLRSNHGPDRWAPLGERVQILQYPGPEADLRGGMDRLDPEHLLSHLERLR
ncbi:MAG TPA: glycosyltransferase family 9 protein [Holophagaceae bacterium]